jgi:hypothetical protein
MRLGPIAPNLSPQAGRRLCRPHLRPRLAAKTSLGGSAWRLPLPACGERVGVRGRCHRRCREYCIPNAFDISQNVVVPEPQHAVAMLNQPSVAHRVVLAFCMLAAVDLDYKTFLPTNKIGNVRPDRLLAYKLEACQRSRTKISPKLLFGASRTLAQSSGQPRLRYVCAAHASKPPHPNPLPASGERESPRPHPRLDFAADHFLEA